LTAVVRIRYILIALFLISLPATLAGCAPAATSPEQAVTGFFSAVSQQDFETAWSLVDMEQQEQLAAELEELRSDSKGNQGRPERLARSFGSAFRPADVNLPPHEFFAAAMKSGMESDAQLKSMLKSPPRIVDTSGEGSGPSADVIVKFGDADAAPKVIRCVRDGAGWRVRFAP
jgi:hypothetical protein